MAEWLTVYETARIMRVHPSTVREWARKGRIRAKKIGKSWFVHQSVAV